MRTSVKLVKSEGEEEDDVEDDIVWETSVVDGDMDNEKHVVWAWAWGGVTWYAPELLFFFFFFVTAGWAS